MIFYCVFFLLSVTSLKITTGKTTEESDYVWKIAGLKNRSTMKFDKFENEITGGSHFHVFKALQQKLRFTYSIVKPIDNSFGYQTKNGSWFGVTKKIIYKEADMCFIGLYITADRLAIMDFSFPLTFPPTVFVIKGPRKILNWDSIIKPFSMHIWIAIATTVFIFGIILHKVVQEDFISEEIKIYWPRKKIFWNLFCTFVYQGIQLNDVKRFPSRLLFGIWLLSILILGSSYSGTLMSFMTYPSMERVPRDFDELAAAVQRGEYSCGTIFGGVSWKTIKGSKSKNVKIITDHIVEHHNFLVDSQAIKRVREERFAFIRNRNVIKRLIRKEELHEYLISEDSVSTFIQAYGIRKHFPFAKRASDIVLRLFEAGINEKVDHSQTTKLLQISEFQALDMTDMISPMLLFLSGYVLSFICLCFEFLYEKILVSSARFNCN